MKSDDNSKKLEKREKILCELETYIPEFKRSMFQHTTIKGLKMVRNELFKNAQLPYPFKMWKKTHSSIWGDEIEQRIRRYVSHTMYGAGPRVDDLNVVAEAARYTELIIPLIELRLGGYPVKAYLYANNLSSTVVSIESEYPIEDRFEHFGHLTDSILSKVSRDNGLFDDYQFDEFVDGCKKFTFAVYNMDLYVFFSLFNIYLSEKYPDDQKPKDFDVDFFGRWHKIYSNTTQNESDTDDEIMNKDGDTDGK